MPNAVELLLGAAPFIVLECPPCSSNGGGGGGGSGGGGDGAPFAPADAVLVVLQLHLPPAQDDTAVATHSRGAGDLPRLPGARDAGGGGGALGTPVSAALLLADERPMLPARLPGPQVNVLPFTEAEVVRAASFERIWPPHRSPENFLLFR
jgi:hypothetical protein